MQEIWRSLEGYEGYYEVSNMGRVKSIERVVKTSGGTKTNKERVLKQSSDNYGYLSVTFSKEGKTRSFKTHQLVAIAFLGHKPCGHKLIIDHIDNDCKNNHANNLQITSNRENTSKDKKGGTSKYTGVYWQKKNKKWRANIKINGKNVHLGMFVDEYEAHLAYTKALEELHYE